MNVVLVVVVAVLAAIVGYLASQLRRRSSGSPGPNAEVRVDTEGLVTAVKEAVDARVGKAAQEALKTNTELAGQLIDQRSRTLEEQTKILLQPVTEQMGQLKASVGDLKSTYEKNKGSVESLNESLTQQINELTSRTGALAGALKSPSARGAWGENQLRNIIDLSGMASYCDYSEQTMATGDEGRQKPDLTVRLPNGARLVIDSKVPLASYLRMQELDDPAAREVELKGAQRQDKGPPCFIWTFNTQQVNCLRDKDGEIIEGAVDDIRTVYYAMAVVKHPELEKTLEYPWMVSELAIVGNQPSF